MTRTYRINPEQKLDSYALYTVMRTRFPEHEYWLMGKPGAIQTIEFDPPLTEKQLLILQLVFPGIVNEP